MSDDIARKIAEQLSYYIVEELVTASTVDEDAVREYTVLGKALRASGAQLIGGAFLAAAGMIAQRLEDVPQ